MKHLETELLRTLIEVVQYDIKKITAREICPRESLGFKKYRVSSDLDVYFNAEEIVIPTTDTVKIVGTCRGLFYLTETLRDVSGLRNWDMSDVKDTAQMFFGSGISDLAAFSSWNLPHTENACLMFAECPNVHDLSPLAGWDLSGIRCLDGIILGTGWSAPENIKQRLERFV